jgi:hypothetical protein
MSTIYIKRTFESDTGRRMKSWEQAHAVVFTAWISPEDVDKAEKRMLKRVADFIAKHPEARACDGIESFEAYNGEIIVECALENPAVCDC